MVLQRAPFQATIWGYSSKIGDNVTVSLNGTIVASAPVRMNVFNVFDGFWLVKLPPVSVAGPFNITVTSSEGKLKLHDVLFGDVWICSGGSNMAMTLNKIYNSSAEIEDAVNYPNIRLFTVKEYPFEYPIYNVQIKQDWSLPNKIGTDDNFSALCWLYGKYLYQTLGYPLGLIDASYANSSIGAWTPPEAAADCGIRDHTVIGRSGNTVAASSLWNGMVHPFANMTIYGAIMTHVITIVVTANYIMGIRYAWEETPCQFKKCAIYSRINALPAPTYISMGMS
ncbi:hypothetical protein KUTeg_006886 [Tegillarca granosa]|uniref:Sialate O-acetylesterase domain-containing protein n=1 Tax=Tegillarca granosa TaxID=220873 RepID=A0ABQ9FBM8_TEGGR|nr:hypothetical protein KUTeg_006886 [Tegillarca granosa]